MTTAAKIIADSVSLQGIRLTTMQLRYPKFVHGEFMTHRVFSRNASSSRAIPVERLIQDVIDDPAMPVYWGSNKPGMQAGEELPGDEKEEAIHAWLKARNNAVMIAREMSKRGLHKQIANRIIEPYCHINVVVTATEWANFYALRRHSGAQPEMKALADAMWEAQQTSIPTLLQSGEWHLPYVTLNGDLDIILEYLRRNLRPIEFMEETRIRLSVARCARVSYLATEGKKPTIEEDLKLYDRLVGSVPLHASPAEHQATPDARTGVGYPWYNPREHGNLVGWRQFRKTLPNEVAVDG